MTARRIWIGVGLVLVSGGCLGCEPTGGMVAWTEPGVYDALERSDDRGRTDGQTPADEIADGSLPFTVRRFQERWPGFAPTNLHFFTASASPGINLTDIDDWDDYPDDGHQTLEISLRSDEPHTLTMNAGTYAEYEEEPPPGPGKRSDGSSRRSSGT